MQRKWKWVRSIVVCVLTLSLLGFVGFTEVSSRAAVEQGVHFAVAEGTEGNVATASAEDIEAAVRQQVTYGGVEETAAAAKTSKATGAEKGDETGENAPPEQETAVTELNNESGSPHEEPVAATPASREGNAGKPEQKQQPVEVSAPPPQPAPDPQPPETNPPAPPVSLSLGAAKTFSFRSVVQVTNTGSTRSMGVMVQLPMLECNSPYQNTILKSTSYEAVSTSGRVATFNMGDLEPGESKKLIADYTITVHPVTLNSTNETVDKARQAYQQYAGSGNCLTLAQGFINRCQELGLKARLVYGFARPNKNSHMTAGSLQGARHSWAEFHVDGVGWVPVDLTFQYFGHFPYASHIIENYADKAIAVNYLGGSINVKWTNEVL